jgi:hypothetical protein
MKKTIYIILILALIFAFAIVLTLTNLSSITSYALEIFTGGKVQISKIEFGYKDGVIAIELGDIGMKGNIEGNIKRWRLAIKLTKGLYFKDVVMSDFDLTVSDEKGKARYFPFPAELLEVKNGAVTYNKQKFIINEIKLENLNVGKIFTFKADIKNGDLFNSLKVSGEGLYKDKLADIKGQYYIAHMDIGKWSSKIKGTANINGTFTYAKKKFALDGPFDVSNYELKERVLKKPLFIEKIKGNLSLLQIGDIIDIKIRDILFKNTPLVVDLKIEGSNLIALELSSDFFNIQEVKGFIDFEQITKTSSDVWSSIKEGKVKIKRLIYTKENPLSAEIQIKNVGIAYQEKYFNNVEGLLSFDEQKMDISNLSGFFKTSRFYNITGVIPFAHGKNTKVKGNFSINLSDIPSMLDVGELRFKSGTTDGVIELEGKQKEDYRIAGTGKLQNADVKWKRVSVSASGSYRFTNDEITFDPLIISKDGTNIVIRGKWNKKYMGFLIKGNLDTIHLKPFVSIPFDTSGVAKLDMKIQKKDEMIEVDGDVNMDDLYFEIPGFIKKDKGIKSKANLAVLVKEKDISIGHLFYNLDAINLSLKGEIENNRKMDLDIAMDIYGIEKVANLFFFENEPAKGDVEVKIALRDLILPVKKLPYIRGYIKINNGFLRLPWITKPLRNVNLTSNFKGETFNIDIRGLTYGKSILGNSAIHIEGLESPIFSLSLNIDSFNLSDFQDKFEFRIPTINEHSIMANMGGDISIRANNVQLAKITGENLEIKGVLSDRKLNISELKMNTIGGYANIYGIIDLSGATPYIYATGKVSRITGGMFLKAFGEETHVFDSRAMLYGSLSSEGNNMKGLLSRMNGNLIVYSKDGVIKKWNLLSKIFGLLNVYDLLKGKVDLKQEGLSYKRLGATFTVKDGIFNTKDFLIDSPSMLITGNGNLDMNKNEIDGSIAVSPLVTVDRIINKIPILRNIIGGKEKGFFYTAYNVKGPLNDPEISLNFTESIGGKTIEILRNILVLPKEVFEQ